MLSGDIIPVFTSNRRRKVRRHKFDHVDGLNQELQANNKNDNTLPVNNRDKD